jgi:hypothetical protein
MQDNDWMIPRRLYTAPAEGVRPKNEYLRIARLLRREMGKAWAGRSIHEISKRDVVELVSAIE